MEPHIPVKSAISIIPGRIYVEVASQRDAVNVAMSISSLDASVVRSVPRNEIPLLLGYKQRTVRASNWRTYLGPWKEYCGDIALIVHRSDDPGDLAALLVPRLGTSTYPPAEAMPAAISLQQLCADSPGRVHKCPDGTFTYDNRHYLANGLLVIPVKNVVMSEETLPSIDELDSFYQSGSLESDVYARTMRMIEQRRLKRGDRVKVILGDFSGLHGIVESVEGSVALVDLPSQAYCVDIPVSCLRAHFYVGDEVELCPSSWSKATGWVLQVDADSVAIYLRNLDMKVSRHITDLTL